MKVLNLYAGIGGNRKLWQDVEVTAVELDPKIASIYQDYFPDDKVIVGDAHQYLLEHYKEFDFIWSSPPCPTHSRFNLPLKIKRYPDMKLYQEIILLQSFFKGKFVIENVKSYYKPLIVPTILDGHYYWSNFTINSNKDFRMLNSKTERELAIDMDYSYDDLYNRVGKKCKLALRNCVYPKTGLQLLNCARNIITHQNIEQKHLFD